MTERGKRVAQAFTLAGMVVLPLGLVAGGLYAAWRWWWRPNHDADETEPGANAPDPGGSVDDSGLRGDTLQVWQDYQTQFSDAYIIAAVRDRAAEAHAMATNIVASDTHGFSPKWIQQTYANEAAKRPLQNWVDDNVTADSTVDDVAEGLGGILAAMDDETIRHISFHFTGDAVDLGPVDATHGAWLKARVAKVSGAKLLLDEGGHSVQHVQCPFPSQGGNNA